jgi:hypothetical protein
MLLLVPNLVEGLAAFGDGTNERPFPSVNSQVIEKIVPFFEKLGAFKIVFVA